MLSFKDGARRKFICHSAKKAAFRRLPHLLKDRERRIIDYFWSRVDYTRPNVSNSSFLSLSIKIDVVAGKKTPAV